MNCKKATFLLSKREENKLTWLENVQINTHTAICHACKLFEKQTMLITCLVKEMRRNDRLPDDVKKRIADTLAAQL